jgi:hypothetical protein
MSPAVDNGRVRAPGAATGRRHREHYLLSLFSEHARSSPGSYSPPQSSELHGGAATSPCQGSRPLADDENDAALQTPPTFLYGICYYRSLHRCSWAILFPCIPSRSPYKGHPTPRTPSTAPIDMCRKPIHTYIIRPHEIARAPPRATPLIIF